MNPFLMIPFVLGPVLIAAVNYLAMSTGLVGLPLWEAPDFFLLVFRLFTYAGLESGRYVCAERSRYDGYLLSIL